MSPVGARLRARREALGLSVDQVAKQTRIGRAHLVALEEGRDDDIPPGPWKAAWLRTYHEALGLEEPSPESEPQPEPWVPLSVVRAIGLASVFAVLALVVGIEWGRRATRTPQVAGEAQPDLHVGVTARRNVKVRVEVDGAIAFDGELVGGEARSFEGFHRVALDVPAVEAVRLTHDGALVVPQGRQDAPRRIVFLDEDRR